MSLFSSKNKADGPVADWTKTLKEVGFYKFGHLRSFGPLGEIAAIAVDPVASLLAVGTTNGLIHLIGAPAFQCTLYLSLNPSAPAAAIKFLTFHPGQSRIVCIDAKDTLHSWALGPGCMDDHKGLPMKEVTASLYGDVTCVDIPSPAHSHLFMTMRDGNTLAYDLARRHLSPYKIPNVWQMHEERLRRSGVPGRGLKIQAPMATCLAMHPRDLNILLIGFDGGVIAWDMNEKAAARTFELVLPPGSQGGLSYDHPDIWTERRPNVTCIAWRPDGLVFAVGHDDGCIAIWAFEDPDRPLMVRTMAREDVNMTDAEDLLGTGALAARTGHSKQDPLLEERLTTREPIFKLVWTSFPDSASIRLMTAAAQAGAGPEPPSAATIEYADRSETLLLVLGGVPANDPPAINILQFPPYSPAPPTSAKSAKPNVNSEGLSRADRSAFRDSLTCTGTSSYPTTTPAEDFLLVPRSSPYFGLAHDAIAIIIMLTPDPAWPTVQGPKAARGMQMLSFPPPRSHIPPASPGRKDHLMRPGPEESAGAGLAMSQAPMSPGMLSPTAARPAAAAGSSWRSPWSSAPASPNPIVYADGAGSRTVAKPVKQLRLPAILWSGDKSVLRCDVHPLELPNFKRLIRWTIEEEGREEKPRAPFYGGKAIGDVVSHGAPDPKAIKLESYRIMSTITLDLSVRFWDVSPHILVLPNPLKFEYPSPLSHLTISIGNILRHPSLAHMPIATLYKSQPQQVKITQVELSKGSLEGLVAMSTGDVFVYKFGEASAKSTTQSDYFPDHGEEAGGPQEITSLAHLANHGADGFKPVMLLSTNRGQVVSMRLSDIGFFAVAFSQKSLAVVDLRGPDVILREGYSEDGKKVKKRKGSSNLPAESSQACLVDWTISRLGQDASLALRLVVSYAKGLTKIFVLSQSLGEWIVEQKAFTYSHDSLANPLANFVLDAETGEELSASSDSLLKLMRPGDWRPSIDKQTLAGRSAWIACASKSIRIQLDFNGERIAKVDAGEEVFKSCHVVQKNGNRVLVAVTGTGSAIVHAIPSLTPITRVDLTFGMPSRPLGRISFDSKSGDYVEHISALEIHLRTVFYHRKPLLPRLDPAAYKAAFPGQPIPVNATSGLSSWIWGGASMTGAQLDYLVAGPNRPPIPKPPTKPSAPLITWGVVPEPPAAKAPSRPAAAAKRSTHPPARDRRERVDVYEEMTNNARERGATLDTLNERLEGMTQSAADMVKSAKNLAAKETAKATARSWFGF